MQECLEVFGPTRQAVLAHELTKMHERVVRGTLAQLLAVVQEKARGEFTVVISSSE